MATKFWFTSSAQSNSNARERWSTRDIGAFGFTLSIVLLGTILSAYTDRPAFWLLVGPGSLAIGFTALTLLRRGFGKRHRSPAAEAALKLGIPTHSVRETQYENQKNRFRALR